MGGETGEGLGQGMADLFYFYDSSISFPYSFLISTRAYIRLDDLCCEYCKVLDRKCIKIDVYYIED